MITPKELFDQLSGLFDNVQNVWCNNGKTYATISSHNILVDQLLVDWHSWPIKWYAGKSFRNAMHSSADIGKRAVFSHTEYFDNSTNGTLKGYYKNNTDIGVFISNEYKGFKYCMIEERNEEDLVPISSMTEYNTTPGNTGCFNEEEMLRYMRENKEIIADDEDYEDDEEDEKSLEEELEEERKLYLLDQEKKFGPIHRKSFDNSGRIQQLIVTGRSFTNDGGWVGVWPMDVPIGTICTFHTLQGRNGVLVSKDGKHYLLPYFILDFI